MQKGCVFEFDRFIGNAIENIGDDGCIVLVLPMWSMHEISEVVNALEVNILKGFHRNRLRRTKINLKVLIQAQASTIFRIVIATFFDDVKKVMNGLPAGACCHTNYVFFVTVSRDENWHNMFSSFHSAHFATYELLVASVLIERRGKMSSYTDAVIGCRCANGKFLLMNYEYTVTLYFPATAIGDNIDDEKFPLVAFIISKHRGKNDITLVVNDDFVAQ